MEKQLSTKQSAHSISHRSRGRNLHKKMASSCERPRRREKKKR
ncbi:hypothetical protein FQN60_013127, partial [Etheostoma spectabile]